MVWFTPHAIFMFLGTWANRRYSLPSQYAWRLCRRIESPTDRMRGLQDCHDAAFHASRFAVSQHDGVAARSRLDFDAPKVLNYQRKSACCATNSEPRLPMKHAGPDALATIANLIASIRGVVGLAEKGVGVFYKKGQAFLHFHEDPTGMYADVKVDDAWQRHPVQTLEQQQDFLAKVVGDIKH